MAWMMGQRGEGRRWFIVILLPETHSHNKDIDPLTESPLIITVSRIKHMDS